MSKLKQMLKRQRSISLRNADRQRLREQDKELLTLRATVALQEQTITTLRAALEHEHV